MKKNFFIIIGILIAETGLSQISVYDCDAFNNTVTQAEIDATFYEYFKQCISFDVGNYLFNGTSNKKVTASTQIALKPGFHAGAYTNTGGMHLNILPKSDFDVAVMNYEDLDNVMRYEKLELGVQLPQNLLDKVNNFVHEMAVPHSEKLNPYVDWDMKVYAEFIHYASSPSPISIDGFFTKEFTSWNAEILPAPINGELYATEIEYKAVGGWNETVNNFPFRIRFAPPKNGQWKTRVKIEVEGINVLTSEFFLFNVVESGNPGYVGVGQNGRYLKHNGKTFFPVGCNLPWPVTDKINDPELFDNMSGIDWMNIYREIDEDYQQWYCAPRVYDKYKNVMNQLANNGANYMRTIMYPSGTDIEWEKIGNYTARLHMAQELDEILTLAEERELFIHWDMQIHYSFQFSEFAYDKQWCWDNQNDGMPFCYKTLIGTNSPKDFLTNEDAKKYYKQRIRYILARWGYSTNIALFELFSEISNVGSIEADNADFYRLGNNWQLSNNWQKEMAAYVKSHYNGKIHLLTASYAGEKTNEDNIFADPNFDVMTSNIYDFEKPDFSRFWSDNVSREYLNDGYDLSGNTVSYTAYQTGNLGNVNVQIIHKPMLFSESDPINSVCNNNFVELERAMWQGMFSGLAGAISWDARKYPQMFHVFGEMRNFISQFELDSEMWHPGASEQWAPNYWHYNLDFREDMDGSINPSGKNSPKRERKADLSYLRSGDGNFVIGVITNKTYNVNSLENCMPVNYWPTEYVQLNSQISVDCETEKLKLRGLTNSKYLIEYYRTSNLLVPVGWSDDHGPKVKIQYTIPASNYAYIRIFKARSEDFSWTLFENNINQEVESDALSNETKEVTNEMDYGNNIDSTFEFKVFPVPSNNSIDIEINKFYNNLIVLIKSVDGRIVTKKNIFDIFFSIDISSYENGTYIVEIVHNTTVLGQRKMIKI